MYHYVLHPSESVLRMKYIPDHAIKRLNVQIDEIIFQLGFWQFNPIWNYFSTPFAKAEGVIPVAFLNTLLK